MYRICQEEDEGGPWEIFRRLLATHEEMTELAGLLEQDVNVAFMIRGGEWGQGGRTILGKCYMPRVQGDLAQLFAQLLEDTLGYFPDFLIVINGDWWETATPTQREILIFHEALHASQSKDQYGCPRFNRITGEPILAIRPHDVEEFNAVVERYGAWKCDLAAFLHAAEVGRGREEGNHSAGRDETLPKDKREKRA